MFCWGCIYYSLILALSPSSLIGLAYGDCGVCWLVIPELAFNILMGQNDRVRKSLSDLQKNIKRLPQTFRLLLKGKRGRIAIRTLAMLQRIPGKPIYPLRWTSAKQRRAFFATKGFGGGIPSKRSGAIVGAWQAEPDPVFSAIEGRIVLSNPHPKMPFLQGSRSQKFHRDTGWVQIADVVDTFIKEAGALTMELWEESTGRVFK